MRRLLTLRRTRDERGVVAIIVGLLAVMLLMFAAYAVDIGLQVNKKQLLNDTLDAAAQAGAYQLPGSSASARTTALAYAKAHDPSETGSLVPNVDFWCVVASVAGAGGTYTVDTTQIPSTCYPGPTPYTTGANYGTTGSKISCSAVLCAIPCVEPTPNTGSPPIACNTIRVYQGRTVPFQFGPAGGIKQGYTGNIVSVACKGSCGTIAPNPMDVVVVADRTPSMAQSNIDLMVSGIKSMLKVMSPNQQYVALGTIGRSVQTSTSSAESKSCTSYSQGLTYPASPSSNGLWIPISFSNGYGDGSGNLTSSDKLNKGLDCLSSAFGTYAPGGTFLASPMKAAARYLLGYDSNNLLNLPAQNPTPTKVIIFETDGQPYENTTSGGSTALTTNGDIVSNYNDYDTSTQTGNPTTSGPTSSTSRRSVTTGSGWSQQTKNYTDTYKTTTVNTDSTTTRTYNGGQTACQNLKDVSAAAKQAGILVITIAYNLTDEQCGGSDPYSSSTPYTSSGSVDADDPVITSITPSGAQKTDRYGNITLNTSYAGNAVINQTVTQTTSYTKYVSSPDSAVGDVLAAAASPVSGVASSMNNDCSTSAGRTAENSDGDYFFCAASGQDMAPVFKTALGQVSKGIKLIKLPGS